MKTLTIDLDDEQAAALKRAAESEGRPEIDLARDAVVRYAQRHPSADEPSGELSTTDENAGRGHRRLRTFAMKGAFKGPGGSIADIPEEHLLKGFGE